MICIKNTILNNTHENGSVVQADKSSSAVVSYWYFNNCSILSTIMPNLAELLCWSADIYNKTAYQQYPMVSHSIWGSTNHQCCEQ